MPTNNTIITVSLTQSQWDIISSILDGTHENLDATLKDHLVLELTPGQIKERKEYCNDIIEILDDIADQISGITEELDN